MRTDLPVGRDHRDRTWLESLAGALPSAGAMAWLRARVRPAFRGLLARSGPMRAVLPGGEIVTVSPRHRHMTWNRDEYAAFRAAVHPGAVVIDAGANVGAYTMLFAQWAGPHGRVFAFEPDPSAFEGLVAHIGLNGLEGRIAAVHAAVTDGAESRVRLVRPPSSGLARLARPGERGDDSSVEVDAVSIDEFCSNRGISPSVIKIDVEGAELEVLRGARKSIAAAGSELALFVEIHPSIWSTSEAGDLQRECEALGLVAEALDGTVPDVWMQEGVCLRLRHRARRQDPS